jgi:hypothetical protein
MIAPFGASTHLIIGEKRTMRTRPSNMMVAGSNSLGRIYHEPCCVIDRPTHRASDDWPQRNTARRSEAEPR